MTDGTTALPVSPVNTEDDAMNLSRLFSRAAQAIVDASTYPAIVADLTAQVESLRDALNSKTIHAEELDRSLHEVRQARDEANASCMRLTFERDQARQELEMANLTIEDQRSKLASTDAMLTQARKDRDDCAFNNLELEEEITRLKDQAAAARVRMNDVLALFQPKPEAPPAVPPGEASPVPEPVPEPEAIAEPKPQSPSPPVPQEPQAAPEVAPTDAPWWTNRS